MSGSVGVTYKPAAGKAIGRPRRARVTICGDSYLIGTRFLVYLYDNFAVQLTHTWRPIPSPKPFSQFSAVFCVGILA
jgi:hypothetical protein